MDRITPKSPEQTAVQLKKVILEEWCNACDNIRVSCSWKIQNRIWDNTPQICMMAKDANICSFHTLIWNRSKIPNEAEILKEFKKSPQPSTDKYWIRLDDALWPIFVDLIGNNLKYSMSAAIIYLLRLNKQNFDRFISSFHLSDNKTIDPATEKLCNDIMMIWANLETSFMNAIWVRKDSINVFSSVFKWITERLIEISMIRNHKQLSII